MNFAGGLFSAGFEWISWIITMLVCLFALRKAPWVTIYNDSSLQNRFLGCLVVIAFVWQMNVNLNIGVIIHFMGMTTLTLFFGWPLAILAGVIAQLVDTLWNGQAWSVVGCNLLFNVVIPVLASWWVHIRIEHFKPTNPFVFILGSGFFGCVFSTSLTTLAALGSLKLFGVVELKLSVADYLGYLPIFVFPEAVVNGMFISATTILHPYAVVAFNEARYFKQSEREMILDEYIEPALDLEQTEAPEEDEQDDSRYRPPKDWYDKDKDS
ncbi:energy-coupling factor ABC transporter permease [Marinomonas fungiae]|uniref:Uncharacterized membrane protein n=1 Tax=Marinomonas fungiae TaxID=1137284 RepID=A0A0K6IIG5_9GAMM|nr:energy-coupling factor ABC transporter permease [Marinomonas fungiae]CUB02899.1 Uncharacterized membrane protein [Marinomonas fungiae]